MGCVDSITVVWRRRTALANTGVEDFGQDFVSAGNFDGVVVDELHRSAEAADESYSLGLRDLVSRHLRFVGRLGDLLQVALRSRY